MQYPEKLADLFNLSGQVALVTGASSGIGAHAAKLYADAGCKLVLAARRLDRVEALAAELDDTAAATLAIEMDVANRGSVERAVAATVARFGSVDILLNNAGVAATNRLTEMTEAEWSSVIDTNLSGVWRTGQIVGRQMVLQQRGSIINMASILGVGIQRNQANYASSKAAVIQLTRSMALELGPSGVRVNALAPGYFETEINRDFFASEKGASYVKSLFPGRPGRLNELDGPLLLLSSGAGSYLQGGLITVDGGTLLGSL